VNTPDLTIIGGGIVGLATAYAIRLRHPGLRLAVIEKEPTLASHQTDRNSGVIHSGIYYAPGSAKAVNCVRGYGMLLQFCEAHDVPFELCGKVIAATSEDQFAGLDRIHQRGVANGLKGLRLLDADEVREIEPHCRALRGIFVPQSGIVDYRAVALALAERLRAGGVDIICDFPVTALREYAEHVLIRAGQREFRSHRVITCAGLYSDKLARLAGLTPPHQIVPFRGEFYQLTDEAARKVRGLIYPVPDPNFPFLGVHLTKRISGGVEAGPNAVLAFRREGYRHLDIHAGELAGIIGYPGFLKLAAKHWRKGLDEMHRSFSRQAFVKSVQALMPDLGINDMYRSRAGVRAQALDRQGNLVDDYVVLEQDRILHLINAPSPAATSCLSIGENMADRFDRLLGVS
jgi:L-2-hydroxyglutarate oxidase